MAPELRRTLGFRDLFLFYIVTTLQPALDRDGRRGRTERARHLGDRGARPVRAARVHRARAVVALSRRRRHLRLEQARVRPVRRVHHRLDVLGIEPAVLSRACCTSRPPTRCSSAGRRGRRSRPTARTSSIVSIIGLGVAVDAERRRAERRQVAEQRRRDRRVGPGLAADRASAFSRGCRSDRRRRSRAASLVPSTGLKDVIFWSTIAFAFGGVESGSTMGEEIQDARRTVPRAILTAGACHHGPLHRRAR